jgi:ankyrin repeat protein
MSRTKSENAFNAITSSDERFEKLFDLRSGDVNAVNEEGNSLLYVAASKNQLGKIHFLLDKGANVNFKNERGATPLNVACDKNALDAIQLLIDGGADVNTRTNRGSTPLSCAASGKGCTLVSATALNSVYDFTNVAEILLDNGADVNIENPLLIAVRTGNLKMVQLLLANGANINATNATGENALQIAEHHKHKNIVKFLKDYETVETIHVLQNTKAGPEDPRSVYTMMDASSIRDLREYVAEGKRKGKQSKTKTKTKKHRVRKTGKRGNRKSNNKSKRH